jgi:hypothetical protein
VVFRAPIDLDRRTAQASVDFDGLPRLLKGVPLDYRALRFVLDRPGFVRNPTSCEVTSIHGTATSSAGALDLVAHVGSRGGRLRIGIDEIPDVPLTRVVLRLDGGRNGLLVNSGGLCAGQRRVTVRLKAHNGKRRAAGPALQTAC